MTAYKTIFDITQLTSIDFLYTPFGRSAYFLLIGIIILFLSLNKKSRAVLQSMMHPNFFPVLMFAVFFILISLSIFMTAYGSYDRELTELKNSLINGKGWITAGKVEKYSKVTDEKKGDKVSFEVNKIKFNFDNIDYETSYHDMSGPLRDGLEVRIYYYVDRRHSIKNKITRLEIAE